MRPTLYVIITNHGFGHASRTLAVIRELHRQSPRIRILLNTTVPRWFVESMLGDAPVECHPRAMDTGIRQPGDFFRMDLAGTRDELQRLYSDAGSVPLLEAEARFARAAGVGLVFADIPPLAADLAERVGVPCWMLGNFGWDFIYRYYEAQFPGFAGIADRIAESYRKCARLFRPPFSADESLARTFDRITDVGLTGAVPRFTRADVRRRLRLGEAAGDGDGRPLVLLSFGGLGLAGIPYPKLAEFDGRRRPERLFLTFDREAPSLPNLRIVDDPRLRPIDLLQIVERIISKPGHGVFCEAARNATPLVCLDRENFPETPVLREALRDNFTHRIVSHAEFFTGDWDFITDELTPPVRPQPFPPDGNVTIARAISEFFAA